MTSKLLLPVLFVVLALAAGCGGREVTRTDPDTVTDLSGYWNETDAGMVADSMVAQCLKGEWLTSFASSRGERPDRPVVVVGGIYNKTSEHIDTDLFMNEIERSLLESGKVLIAAGGTSRMEARSEREEQSIFAASETAAEFGREVGADFVMTGRIGSIVDQEGDTRSIYYQVNLELVDVETALKTWMGGIEIKKIIDL